jgi:serine/threonine protein phosphatase PrpC
MSRAIGDLSTAKYGIIPTPVTTAVSCTPGSDFFIVAGSDGIWDVMENEEVINFVEKYRGLCVHEMESTGHKKSFVPSNTCIAHLLCEEARQRWLTIVEEEDVLMDDISAVVYELRLEDSSDGLLVNPIEVIKEESEESGHSSGANKCKGLDVKRASIIP